MSKEVMQQALEAFSVFAELIEAKLKEKNT